MVCVGSVAVFARKRHAPQPSVQPEVEAVSAVRRESSEPSLPSDPAAVGNEAPPTPAGPTQPAVSARRQPVPLTLPEPSSQTRQLVSTLLWPGQVGRPFTSEQAVEWKQNLQQLVQQGASGVPAIIEFLKQNKDLDFGSGVSQALGYASARQAMFDALTQIGGPEAISGILQTLQTTAEPREIALLSQNLEKLEPEQHRQEELEAARQVLATASARKLEASDVAPLFEVLQKYGGPAVITELEQAAKHWSYYGTIALAQLPDGAGIPGLISIAQDPKTANGAREAAFQMLAQVFPQSPEARAVLLQQARSGAISEYAWRIMAPVLAGDQVGLLNSAFEDHQGLIGARGLRTTRTSDNQSYFVLPSNLTPDQVAERTALIDELLVATADATAREVLEQSKNRLTTQLPSTVSVSR
jgi:hypothetical protein